MNLWTDEEVDFLVQNYIQMSDKKLSVSLSQHSQKSIQSKRFSLGLKRPAWNKKYSYSDFERMMDEKGYEIVSPKEDYQNAGSIMSYYCPKHKDKGLQTITLGRLKEGKGCTYCGRERTIEARTKFITDDMKKNIFDLCAKRDFEFISITRDNDMGKNIINVSFICNTHRTYGVQKVTYHNFIRNQKCKYCAHKSLSHEDILSMVNQSVPHIQILSNFNKLNDYVDCVCTIHGTHNNTKIVNLIHGHGCYLCGLDKLSAFHTMDETEIDERIKVINPSIKRIESCKGITNQMTFQCQKCMHIWKGKINSIRYCPNCEKEYVYSGEHFLHQIFKSNNIHYEIQKRFDGCKNKRHLPFDFYLPDYNVCFEYQGQHHYKALDFFGGEDAFKIRCKNDQIKRDFCKQNQIALIEIPYTYNTFESIEKYLFDKLKLA